MLRPAWKLGEEPDDVDPARVAPVAAEFRFPLAKLVAALRQWLWTWTHWRRTAENRRRARDRLNKMAAWAKERGDTAGAEEARARLHRGTALAWRLERRARLQPCPELVEQLRERTEAARRRPPPEATEPSLTRKLAILWLEHRGVLPAPGGGEVANEFIRFVTDTAVALGIHAPSDTAAVRWRTRWRRERAVAKKLRKGRVDRP